ncbi:hypothetical protein ACH4YO_16735 [Streptomyces noursei]|uniref:hypothetical protein n=1 Tax=Streptomyces noursei TaxID=1971 RepID=UPI00081CEAC3|nr:hypothetical protein [Streptomyces noursei]ANZ15194.1 membrane protein [Streptomyces noursei ATCC 11455]MCZ0992507.1 hypothetical protein [Streptomyces noursei]MCZ1019136.1 hypothetical protein [Streptomyces noursei]GGX47069.1 hypothetical protein GCM10010341_81050 [Streptomyces noursei]
MRKLQQVMIVAAAAGGLTAVGAGVGTAYAHEGGRSHNELFRPYQECSPQTVADANLPLGVLAVPETWGTTCGQFNHSFTK